MPREAVLRKLEAAAAVLFTGLREEGGMALAEAMFAGVPVIVLAHGGARAIAESALESSRVALIYPQGVAATARSMGEAMTRFVQSPHMGEGSSLDRDTAVRQLQECIEAVLSSAHGVAAREYATKQPGVSGPVRNHRDE
jgi:glycosyltransferase involved in cell wall biosynthesis